MTCNGCDIDLIPRDSSYASLPDLRETRHSGDVLDCVLKEYDSRAGTLSISVKETEPEPFDGWKAPPARRSSPGSTAAGSARSRTT